MSSDNISSLAASAANPKSLSGDSDAPVLYEQTGRVVLVRLNRPKALNALTKDMMTSIVDTLTPLDDDPEVGCFVVTGNEKAFSAGADISGMKGQEHMDMFHENFLAGWDHFAALRTPKVAAVAGYALGGGCELAMICDTIYAADNAQFGQPEINLGLTTGMGGSQRLTRLVGRAKAMDMMLTSRNLSANEAEAAGLAARVFPLAEHLDRVMELASTIAGFSKTTAMMARDVVNEADETALQAGLRYERRVYHSIFSTPGAYEGIDAFLEKRQPKFH